MKKIMIIMMALIAAIFTANAQSTTAADSIKALQAENAKLRNDLQAVTAVGESNSKGCLHLHLDTLRRVIKGVESCNGFYAGIGAGYDYTSWSVADENTSGTTGAAVVTAKFGYRHFWFRPEISATVSAGKETIENRDFTAAKFKAVVNFDILRFAKVEERHCPVDPYFFAGISYNVIMSKKETSLGNIPYDGNMVCAEAGVGTMIKLGTFNNGHTKTKVGGKQVSLKRKSEIFLDINVPFSYGTLSKPRLASDAAQPIMKKWSVTPTISLVAKF